jgi:hypothetical protein
VFCLRRECAGHHPDSSEELVDDSSTSEGDHNHSSVGDGIDIGAEHNDVTFDNGAPCHNVTGSDVPGRHPTGKGDHGHCSAGNGPTGHRSTGYRAPRYGSSDNGATDYDHDD